MTGLRVRDKLAWIGTGHWEFKSDAYPGISSTGTESQWHDPNATPDELRERIVQRNSFDGLPGTFRWCEWQKVKRNVNLVETEKQIRVTK